MTGYSSGLLRRTATRARKEQPEQFAQFLDALHATTGDRQGSVRIWFEDAPEGGTVADVLRSRGYEDLERGYDDLDRLMVAVRNAGARQWEKAINDKERELDALRGQLVAWDKYVDCAD